MSETKGNFDKDPALDFSSNNYNANYNNQFGASPPPYPGANPNPGFNYGANPRLQSRTSNRKAWFRYPASLVRKGPGDLVGRVHLGRCIF